MNKVMGIIMLCLTVATGAYLAWFTCYLFGFRKTNQMTVDGFLESSVQKRKVFRGHPFSGKWHPFWSEYTYVYRVDGKPYRVRGGCAGLIRDLPQRVKVICQKTAPQHAFVPRFEKPFPGWGILLFFAGFAVMGFACVMLLMG